MLVDIPVLLCAAFVRSEEFRTDDFVEVVDPPVESIDVKVHVAPAVRKPSHVEFCLPQKAVAQVGGMGSEIVVCGTEGNRPAIVSAGTELKLVEFLYWRSREERETETVDTVLLPEIDAEGLFGVIDGGIAAVHAQADVFLELIRAGGVVWIEEFDGGRDFRGSDAAVAVDACIEVEEVVAACGEADDGEGFREGGHHARGVGRVGGDRLIHAVVRRDDGTGEGAIGVIVLVAPCTREAAGGR